MNNVDLNMQELTTTEMKETQGGIFLILAAVFVAGVIVGIIDGAN